MLRILPSGLGIIICLSATTYAQSPLDPTYGLPRSQYCDVVKGAAYSNYVYVAAIASSFHTTFLDVIEHDGISTYLPGNPDNIMPARDYVAMMSALAGWDTDPAHFKPPLTEQDFQNHVSGFIGETPPLSEQWPLFSEQMYNQCMKGF